VLIRSCRAEDDPQLAVKDLTRIEAEAKAERQLPSQPVHVVLIGVSCGYSATYVGAQLQHGMKQMEHEKRSSAGAEGSLIYTVCAVGFNPMNRLTHKLIPSWAGHTFLSQLESMQEKGEAEASAADPATTHSGVGNQATPAIRHILINPVVGPEAVAGSTRMKGGSATKILLELSLYLGIQRAVAGVSSYPLQGVQGVQPTSHGGQQKKAKTIHQEQGPGDSPGHSPSAAALQHLDQYAATMRCVYSSGPMAALAQLVEEAGKSLSGKAGSAAGEAAAGDASAGAGGRLIYFGSASLALLGIVDASECPPTYGSAFTDVQVV
jgi:hypothetical protein